MRRIAVVLLVLGLVWPVASASADQPPLAERLRDVGGPADQLRRHISHLLDVLRDPALKPVEQTERREAAVRKAMMAAFDVRETARRVTAGRMALTVEQRTEANRLLTEALTAMMGRLAIHLLGAPATALDQRETTVRYLDESVDGELSLVHTVVTGKGGSDIPVTASMIRRGTHWLLYDLRVHEVSLVESYRAQCEALLRRLSYAGLAERLRTKRDDFVALENGRLEIGRQ